MSVFKCDVLNKQLKSMRMAHLSGYRRCLKQKEINMIATIPCRVPIMGHFPCENCRFWCKVSFYCRIFPAFTISYVLVAVLTSTYLYFLILFEMADIHFLFCPSLHWLWKGVSSSGKLKQNYFTLKRGRLFSPSKEMRAGLLSDLVNYDFSRGCCPLDKNSTTTGGSRNSK